MPNKRFQESINIDIYNMLKDKPPLWSKLFLLIAGATGGEVKATISELQELLSWQSGYRKEKPTPKMVRGAYEGLSEGRLINITAGKDGLQIRLKNQD